MKKCMQKIKNMPLQPSSKSKVCKCPTPRTNKSGKCPTVAWGGGGGEGTWVQLELTDALIYNIKGKCNYSFGGLEPALHFA